MGVSVAVPVSLFTNCTRNYFTTAINLLNIESTLPACRCYNTATNEHFTSTRERYTEDTFSFSTSSFRGNVMFLFALFVIGLETCDFR